jgi:hypothetical protein
MSERKTVSPMRLGVACFRYVKSAEDRIRIMGGLIHGKHWEGHSTHQEWNRQKEAWNMVRMKKTGMEGCWKK